MTVWFIPIVAAAAGLCLGGVIIAVLCDRANKAEHDRMQREMHRNSVMYLRAVQTMEQQIHDKEQEIEIKQRVLDSLNDEVQRLRRIIEKMRRNKAEGWVEMQPDKPA
jgi:predicted RNase H-like nuclease (RuvC/YqgF family)